MSTRISFTKVRQYGTKKGSVQTSYGNPRPDGVTYPFPRMWPNGERVRMDLDFDKYKVQQFCDNLDCDKYGKIGENNIRTHSRLQHQVYCKACKQIWVITKDTFFYNLKSLVSLILEVLKLLSEGVGLRAVCRAKGVGCGSFRTTLISLKIKGLSEKMTLSKRDFYDLIFAESVGLHSSGVTPWSKETTPKFSKPILGLHIFIRGSSFCPEIGSFLLSTHCFQKGKRSWFQKSHTQRCIARDGWFLGTQSS